jgi:hypothetical protein
MNMHVVKHLTRDVVVLRDGASDSPIGVLHRGGHSRCDLEDLMQEIDGEVMQAGHVRHRQDKGVTGVLLPLLERGDDEDVLRAIGDQVLIDLISPDPAEDAVTHPQDLRSHLTPGPVQPERRVWQAIARVDILIPLSSFTAAARHGATTDLATHALAPHIAQYLIK